MRIASRAIATPRRLEEKPGESRTTTARFPSACTHEPASSAIDGSVAAPTTTSTSAEAGTGLKKCSPRNRAGRCRVDARSSIEMADVFEERTRQEERSVGQECVRQFRSRWLPYHNKNNNKKQPR